MSIKVRFVILGWSRYREIYLKTRQPDYFGFVSLIKQQLSTEEHKSITFVTQLTPKTTQALITLSYKFSMCKTHAYCHLCLAYVPIADFLALIPAVKIANLWAFSVGLLQLTPQHLHLEHWGCTQGSRTHLLLSKHNVTTELTQQQQDSACTNAGCQAALVSWGRVEGTFWGTVVASMLFISLS